MARPYPDNFERETSPLSAQSGGSHTPISYSANVNRQKTKKWVEAKPADYGGDDWGDDYNDYSAPPPPLPKSSGLRQAGQISQSPSSGGSFGEETNKKAYGDLPSLPTEAQTRSATNPVRDRANSFTRDDERRAFSGGYAQHSPAPNQAPARIVSQGEPYTGQSTTALNNQPPALYVSTQGPTVTGLRKAVQPNASATALPPQEAFQGTHMEEPQSGASSRFSEATSRYSETRTPSSDFQARRDFSPSAVPPPLQTNHPPGPPSATTDSPSSRFPPRKSSISQQGPSEAFHQTTSAQEIQAHKPWTEARSSSPGAATRSPTTPGKGIPFIRPADIYRRMEEEREKERQSMDSSRPSMESLVSGKNVERSSSPAKSAVRPQSSSEILGGNINQRAVEEREDSVETSQHLAPMLEPIQERKSEYGFEGYDPNRAIGPPEEKTDFPTSKESQMERLSPEEMRRFSTSPKLPDLNRISGFGLDMFSHSSSDEPSFQEAVLKSIPELSSSRYQNDSDLHPQRSVGITPVVHQTFNEENFSNRDSPPSVSSHGERTAGENHSTTGIGPTTSGLPVMIPSRTSDREMDVRENAAPSISEVAIPNQSLHSTRLNANGPERPGIPTISIDTENSSQDPVHSVHDGEMNAPSPENSPVMTPEIPTIKAYHAAAEGHISTTPDPAISPVEEEEQDLPQPSRPFAERELSFRPKLPGGWVSYATSATSSTADQEPKENQRIDTYARHTDPMMDAPVSPISESEDDVDLTPTTAKRSLPRSALGAAAGATFGGAAVAAFEGLHKKMNNSPLGNDASPRGHHVIPGNSALPTPDPALAPIGNPYASSTLDPRLQDEPSTVRSALAVPELHRHGIVSATSTAPPTPPPKDTPANEPRHGDTDYFPPTVPLKHRSVDEVAATQGLVMPMRPQMLPTLSTHTSPQDEESDKLRKEIIKSLSPNISDAEAGHGFVPPEVPNKNDIEDSTVLGARESTYLPSEYDNYWESTNEADAEDRELEAKAEEHSLRQEPERIVIPQVSLAGVEHALADTPPIPPMSPQRAGRGSMEMPSQRPLLPSNRFSWEAGPEQVSSTNAPEKAELQVPSSGIDPRYAATPDSQLRQLEQTREAYFEHGPISTSGNTPALETTLLGQVQEDGSLKSPSNSNNQRRSGDHESSHSNAASDVAVAVAGAAGVTAAAAYAGHQSNQHGIPQRRPSLAEEKDRANVSTYAVPATPPEDEHPARVSQSTIPQSISETATSGQPEGRDFSTAARPQQAPDVTKTMQFRDILAFQNPEQRIRAYNDTRHQFANMDTGLGEWLMVTSNQRDSLPAESWVDPVTAGYSAERPKVPKSSPSSVPGTPLQQPYYQQYLNASPTSSVPSSTRPSTGIISGSQQGFSSSGSKLSGQQGQTKSSGVFGGKAGKAGKGFFAKSKNKLRGSGGGDKDQDSPPLEATPTPKPKVNEGRTSSWNLSFSSLTLPRASARNSTPSQHSREVTPPPQRQSLPSGQTELAIWDAPVSAASTPSIKPSTPQPIGTNERHTSREVGSNGPISGGEQEQDRLAVPTPISKHQPSWDPHNATPIVEEESFQYDERPAKQLLAIPPAIHHLGVSQTTTDPESGHSSSGQLAFSETSEQPLESDDWVIISKESVPKASELSFAAPKALQSHAENQSSVVPQISAGPPPPSIHQKNAALQFRPGVQPAVGFDHQKSNLPLAAYQAPRSHQPPLSYPLATEHQLLNGQQPHVGYQAPGRGQPPIGYQAVGVNQPLRGQQGPPGYQAPSGNKPFTELQPVAANRSLSGFSDIGQSSATSQPPAVSQLPIASQAPASSQGGFRGRFIQHIRQRSSKEGNMPVAGQTSTPPVATRAEQPQLVKGNGNAETPATEFVGLPPIRRSSTFGLGFRSKDPSKRFPLDDDDEDDIPQKPTMPPTLGNNDNQRQGSKSGFLMGSETDHNNRLDSRLPNGEVALGATAIAAAVGDRMNRPSGEPSRYSAMDIKPAPVVTETQQRPPLSNTSSEYSRPSDFSPVSPPITSPMSPPGTRPPFVTGASRESFGPFVGKQAENQQTQTGQDSQHDTGSQPNVRVSQEQRAAPPISYQRPPPIEVKQNPAQIPPIVAHPRNPSFEGPRPTNPSFQPREPSFEGQRLRSASSSSQGNVGVLPTLSSGVFVPSPRAGLTQQKPFDQPPSSAQRYPALFRAEHGGKESPIDGLPAHYYQAPISKEDAFLPRQQTNEYQLPGVGPPPDQPQPTKRNSKRNSGLFKELGGRLSRSASRDRDSMAEDDARSPVRPIDSRDSQSRDCSAGSITSDETLEKKRRRSGLSFFGGLRRESTSGTLQSRESMATHLPVSRTDSLLQPQPQRSNSPLAPPDKKKLFFGSNRSSPDPEKSKPNKLLRASTSSITGEQPGKKKRFSGITNMFSRSSIDQERRGSNGSAPMQQGFPAQQTIRPLQESQYLKNPARQMTPETRRFQEGARSIGQGSPSPQVAPQSRQDQYPRSSPVPGYLGQNTSQIPQIGQGPHEIRRQNSPGIRSGQIAPPLPSPSLLNPTLQHSVIETRPIQDRHNAQQYGLGLQNTQNYQRQTSGVTQPSALSQLAPALPSLQGHPRESSDMAQSTPVRISPSPHNDPQQGSVAPQLSQMPTSDSRSSPNRQLQTSVAMPIAQPNPLAQPAPSSQSPHARAPQQMLATSQPGPSSPPPPNSQIPQGRTRQSSLGNQSSPLSQPPALQSVTDFSAVTTDHRQGSFAPIGGQGIPQVQQITQQPQYQQRMLPDPRQNNSRPAASPQPEFQDRQQALVTGPPFQATPAKIENKQHQGSTARLFGGLIGGRRSSAQQAKNTTPAQAGVGLQMVKPLGQPQQQKREPPLQQLPQQQQQSPQRMSSNIQAQGMPMPNQQQGRLTSQEPQYAPLPIPGAYNLVRGEGGRLAPTPYDPRGLNNRPGPYGNQPMMYRDQAHSYQSRPPQIQIQPYPNDHYAMANQSSPPQITTNMPQNMDRDGRPGPGPQQNSQNGNKQGKHLSSEDVMARSPARPQFGQQAPYQLSLPDDRAGDENAGNDIRNQPLPTDKNVPPERQLPSGGEPHIDKILPTERNLPTERALPPTEYINTNQQLSNPSLRHPQSPATYPLPEHAPFSPVNPKADGIPAPPPPKWPQQTADSQSLDRSNTINTHASEVSQISGGQLNVPGSSRPKEQEHRTSITPPSPQITPERSPDQVSRHIESPSQEEDIYSASPRHSVATGGAAPVTSDAPQHSPEKILVDGKNFQDGRRRASQEEKILVEEGMIRPGSQEEEPSMSATSYPGQEWHPYGNGYEEWD